MISRYLVFSFQGFQQESKRTGKGTLGLIYSDVPAQVAGSLYHQCGEGGSCSTSGDGEDQGRLECQAVSRQQRRWLTHVAGSEGDAADARKDLLGGGERIWVSTRDSES